MTRQKKPLDRVLEKYTAFLTMLKELSYETEDNLHSFTHLISDYQIDKNIKKALIYLKIIDLENDKTWYWLSFDVDRKLVITILNHILERRKKNVDANLPLEGFTNAVNQMTQLTELIRHERKTSGLNGFKMPVRETNLFADQDLKEARRWELFKVVLPSLYTGRAIGELPADLVEILNEFALSISDNALVKFYTKQKTTA